MTSLTNHSGTDVHLVCVYTIVGLTDIVDAKEYKIG